MMLAGEMRGACLIEIFRLLGSFHTLRSPASRGRRIQSLRAFRRPGFAAKWCRWVGGLRGRGAPKGLLFEVCGALGEALWAPKGPLWAARGQLWAPRGSQGTPREHPGGHLKRRGGRQGTPGEPKHSKSARRYCKNRCWCFFLVFLVF